MKEIDAVGACICLSCKLFSNRNATITYCNIKGSRTHVRSTCQLKTLSHAAICLFNCKSVSYFSFECITARLELSIIVYKYRDSYVSVID